MNTSKLSLAFVILMAGLLVSTLGGCGGGSAEDSHGGAPPQGKSKGGGPPAGMQPGNSQGPSDAAAVPVEVTEVSRRSISSFMETNGTLEAENEVDIVARVAGPILELATEEGRIVKKGQLLAKIDPREAKAQVEVARVALAEATRAHERAKQARESEIISVEVYDQALGRMESAQAQLNNAQISLDYTDVTAPFDGIIIERAIKLADNVTPNQKLFRISDFDPLLCPIQVPEKELSRLKIGQPARIAVEAWPEDPFPARVLRISPVVDATTGTIKVTLEVSARGKLRPGMFASVYLEMDTHDNALVIPKSALSFESFGDTVYVAKEGVAQRRDLEVGFEEEDFVEVLQGLDDGERVIVVGQDGLSDGTPVQILAGPGAGEGKPAQAPQRTADGGQSPAGPGPGMDGGMGPGGGRGRMDFSQMTPEQLERVKKRMRDRGMSEEQIEAIIRRRLEESKKQ
jgi:membrane fusion protein (multidrug efflux system)